MSSPKKTYPDRLAEHLATQIAQPGSPVDRRTAALPQAPVPTAAPHARTMTFDNAAIAAAAARPKEDRTRVPQATVISTPERTAYSPPPQPVARPVTWGRWVGGPLLALIVGALTMWVAGLVNAAHPPVKNLGHLRLATDPPGAAVVIEGKVRPGVTPLVVDGEIGATVHVTFKLDGYLDKEADLIVAAGERQFRAKLERHEIVATPEPPPPPEPVPTPPPVTPTPRPVEKATHKKTHEHPVASSGDDTIAQPLGGTGTLSVHVLPWAIVYVDGAKIHQTPLDAQTFGAGIHSVELVNDQLHRKEKVTVEIRNNGHEEIRRDWEK